MGHRKAGGKVISSSIYKERRSHFFHPTTRQNPKQYEKQQLFLGQSGKGGPGYHRRAAREVNKYKESLICGQNLPLEPATERTI